MMKNLQFFLFICSVGLCFIVSCAKDPKDPEDDIKLDIIDDVCTAMDDINFRKFCYDKYDVNHDGVVSMGEANAVTHMSFFEGKVRSFKGIEYFTRLANLSISRNMNRISFLDLSKNLNLEEFYFSNNFYDDQCTLQGLDFSNNTRLRILSCGYYGLSFLKITNCTSLENLGCSNNKISSLDLSKCKSLKKLSCSNNELSSLDLSHNIQLQELYCSSNHLRTLILPHTITTFEINPQRDENNNPYNVTPTYK